MTLGIRILIQAAAGLAVGVALVALTLASALALAFSTSSPVRIPLVIDVWATREPNGTTALNFLPDLAGMGVVVVAFALVFTVVTVTTGRRRRAREG